MGRWSDTLASIEQINIKEHPEVKEVLKNLFNLLLYVHNSIPEVE